MNNHYCLALAVILAAMDSHVANAASVLVLNDRDWRVNKSGYYYRVVRKEKGVENERLIFDTSNFTVRMRNVFESDRDLSPPVAILPSGTDLSKIKASWAMEYNPGHRESTPLLTLAKRSSPKFNGEIWVNDGYIEGSIVLDRQISSQDSKKLRLLEIREVDIGFINDEFLLYTNYVDATVSSPMGDGSFGYSQLQRCAKLPKSGQFSSKFSHDIRGTFADFGLFGYTKTPPNSSIHVSIKDTPSLIAGEVIKRGKSRKGLSIWAQPTSSVASYSFSMSSTDLYCMKVDPRPIGDE